MQKIKGVNLGGWFVLESWMKPELFKDIDSRDETGFCLKNPNAKTDLIKHWETFITLDDFIYIKNLGINSVRLPIPWWLEGKSPYFSALPYIHQAMQWADQTGLLVLLDLHTAPGCQNGFDNGGIEGVIDWPKNPKNINLTIDKLEFIVKEFKKYPSFWGIEVLNEPHSSIDLKLIQDFYRRSYARIRKHTDKTIVFHDAFRPKDPSWAPFFKDEQMENVVFDLHLYHCFDHRLTHGDFNLHLKTLLETRLSMIQEINLFVRTVVGEWSLGMHYQTMIKDDTFDEELYRRILANLQLFVYNHGYGYYFWNYKIQRESHMDWDFRRLMEHGVFQSKF